jgi:2-keto-3-deoxy-L-rhamnonate aldolase RhmA
VVRHADLFARLNPLHPGTREEIDRAVAHGARALMLPYFHVAPQVEAFVQLVNGRATVAALVETASAVACIDEILQVAGLDEVTIGLNDLRLELGAASHFDVLMAPWLDALAARVRAAGIPLGIGGVAHPADRLPVPPDLVLAQYPRLGATSAWVSRSFLHAHETADDFAASIAAIRRRLSIWAAASPDELDAARRALSDCLHSAVCGRSPEAGPEAARRQGGPDLRIPVDVAAEGA